MTKKTIVFDFDGTLGDSFKVVLEIAHQLTNKHQLNSQAEIAHLRTLSLMKAASELQIPKRMWPMLLIRGRKMMADRLLEVKLFDGVKELIEQLKKEEYVLYIVSSNSKKTISQILSNNQLLNYFDNIYGGIGLLGKAKTLNLIIKQKSIKKSDILYIGDESRDIVAAKKNQINSIAVTWGYMSKENLVNNNPWKIVDNFSELYQVIDTWNKTSNDQ